MFEPYRIKVVERIRITTLEERLELISEAKYNVFNLRSEDVMIDLLTDSGTSAISDEQLSAMMRGDESYAGARSWYNFEEAVRYYTGKKFVIPTHQGRGAERLIANALLEKGDVVVSNTLFDTTRANFEFVGAEVVDIPLDIPPEREHPFKGNMDVQAFEDFMKQNASRVKLVVMTITNNSGGGQPVSVENIRKVKEIASLYGKPLMIDACRASENAYFVKHREEGYSSKSIADIVRESLSYADIVLVSTKKDALSHIGGFIATDDAELYDKLRKLLVIFEGFSTYGGISGKDMEIIAKGLLESLDEDHLTFRIHQVKYLNDRLDSLGIPVIKPHGGHAVYIDADAFLSHIPSEEFPGQSLVIALYVEGGIRGVEVGKLMFKHAKRNLVRLAIPRRVYTLSHLDHVARTLERISSYKENIGGMRIVHAPEFLRHFLAHLEPIGNWVSKLYA